MGNMGSAHPLVEVNVSFKFEGNPSISKGVIERTRIGDGRTDGQTDGRPSLPMGICWAFLLFKTTQKANYYPIRRNEWKVLTDGHLLGILVPNKCPSVCPDGRTDRRDKAIPV